MFRDTECLEACLDTLLDGFFVVRELHINDGFSGFYRDAGRGYFHGFYIGDEFSFSQFRQAVTDRVPCERRYDGGASGMGFQIEVHE